MAAAARDRDIRRAMRDALDATGQFDAVYLSGLPEEYGTKAGELRVAVIEPLDGNPEDLWDAANQGGLVVDGTALITFLSRHEDPEVRDDNCELLLNVAFNALNSGNLAGVTLGQMTAIDRWRWLPAAPPERRIQAPFKYQYVVEGWTQFNTTE